MLIDVVLHLSVLVVSSLSVMHYTTDVGGGVTSSMTTNDGSSIHGIRTTLRSYVLLSTHGDH